MPPHLQVILSELKQRLRSLYGDTLVKMVLYGSQARGDAVPDSDVDVLVVLKDDHLSPSAEITRTLPDVAEVSLNHDIVISCVFIPATRFEHEQSPLLLNVRREGTVI